MGDMRIEVVECRGSKNLESGLVCPYRRITLGGYLCGLACLAFWTPVISCL